MAHVCEIVACDDLQGRRCAGCNHIFEFRESMSEMLSEDGVHLGWFCHECIDRWTLTGRIPWWAQCEDCGQLTTLVLIATSDFDGVWLCPDCAGLENIHLPMGTCQRCGHVRPLQEIELNSGERVRFCDPCISQLAQE